MIDCFIIGIDAVEQEELPDEDSLSLVLSESEEENAGNISDSFIIQGTYLLSYYFSSRSSSPGQP